MTGRTTEPRTEPLLRIEGLRVDFATDDGVVHAVDDVSLSVWPGEIVADGRRVGLGQERDRDVGARPAPKPPGASAAARSRFRGEDLRAMSAAQLRKIRGGPVGMIFQDPMTR